MAMLQPHIEAISRNGGEGNAPSRQNHQQRFDLTCGNIHSLFVAKISAYWPGVMGLEGTRLQSVYHLQGPNPAKFPPLPGS